MTERTPITKHTPAQSLRVIADNIEGWWLELAHKSATHDLSDVAKQEADRLREIADQLDKSAPKTIKYDDQRVPYHAVDGDFMMIDGDLHQITDAPPADHAANTVAEQIEASNGPRVHQSDID